MNECVIFIDNSFYSESFIDIATVRSEYHWKLYVSWFLRNCDNQVSLHDITSVDTNQAKIYIYH